MPTKSSKEVRYTDLHATAAQKSATSAAQKFIRIKNDPPGINAQAELQKTAKASISILVVGHITRGCIILYAIYAFFSLMVQVWT